MINLLITAPCQEQVKASLVREFSSQYAITFAQNDPDLAARELKSAEVVIGEPAPALLHTA